jgi:hypothetical protein
MRSALLFAIRLLVPAIVLVYVLAFLAASSMPLADAAGRAQAVPRWEYWLLHISVPSAIWWQWSGGNLPVTISDRLPILVAAAIWVSCCHVIGNQISRCDPIRSRLSKYERIGVAILVGHAALAAIVFLLGSIVGVQSLVWVLVVFVGIVFALERLRKRQTETVSTHGMIDDRSFASSVSRRMIGLLILATSFLAIVQVYGATIPTRDDQVREVDWWLVKHAVLDGKLSFSSNHALVNAPVGFAMPAVAFASAFTANLPSITDRKSETLLQRERWQRRLRSGVLAGKTVNAMLGVIGALLVGVHLARRWGYLSGLFIGFLLIATPGLFELARLGRTEGLIGLWCVGLLVVWDATWDSGQQKASLGVLWWGLAAGAMSSGYGAAVLVGIPACCVWFWLWHRLLACGFVPTGWKPMPPISRTILVVGVLVVASGFYVRNGVASGDPFYPWGRVAAERLGLAKASELGNGLIYANRVPSATVLELVEEVEAESAIDGSKAIKSPYRIANWIDGALRLLWNSNGHGLMLVPMAIVGSLFCWRFSTSRMAIGWFGYWVLMWWLFSLRQDRDWMGAIVLLAWPAAAGSHWIASQARGYFMLVLVSIAICWSVVVLPIWPTSDNRMFVALETLDKNGAAVVAAKFPDDEDLTTPSYSACFNTVRKSEGSANKATVLLIGECDDFDLLAECVSIGPFDQENVGLGVSSQAFGEFIRLRGITEVVIVWSGVQYREKLTGKKTESDYRAAIGEMLQDSQLQPIPWEINSSQAELFRVIKE